MAKLVVAYGDVVKFNREQIQGATGLNEPFAAIVINQQTRHALHLIELLSICQNIGSIDLDAPKVTNGKIAGTEPTCIGTPIAAVTKCLKAQEHVVVRGFRRRNGNLSSVLKKKKKKKRVTPALALAPKPEINHRGPKLLAIVFNAVRKHAAGRNTMTNQVNGYQVHIIATKESLEAGDLTRRTAEKNPPPLPKVSLNCSKANASFTLNVL